MKKKYQLELLNRHQSPESVDALLYTPTYTKTHYLSTNVYYLSYVGEEAAARAFLDHVVVYQQVHERQPTLAERANVQFYLEYGMKSNTLDLEKEYLLKFTHRHEDSAFTITSLSIRKRIYVFGEEKLDPQRLVKDVVNPVIHEWEVQHV